MNWFKSFWKRLWAEGAGQQSRPAYTESGAQKPLANFSPRAQQVLALARREADKLHHNFVGTEHLLLGMVALGQGAGVGALIQMGVNLETMRAEVIKRVGTGPDQKIFGNIPYTPRVKKALALGIKEAMAMGNTYVGTEHILLGLLREGGGVAALVLKGMNVDVEKARAAVLKLHQAGSQEAKEGAVSGADISKNLTPRAQRVLVLAREEVDALNLSYIGTEHVLMGLIRLEQGVAVSVLAKIGLDLKTVGPLVVALAGPRPAEKSGEKVCYSDLVKEALSFAAEEARKLSHTYVGTEHILLALLRQHEGSAASIFRNFNVDTEAVRREILTELNPNFSSSEISMSSNPSQPSREPVDLSLRYDVYCAERSGEAVVVYRDVQFKGVKTLFSRDERDPFADFVELEQRDGKTVWVAKATVVRFSKHGEGKVDG